MTTELEEQRLADMILGKTAPIASAPTQTAYKPTQTAGKPTPTTAVEIEEQRLADQILGLAGFKADVVTIKAASAAPVPASAAPTPATAAPTPAKARPMRYETRFETLDELEVQMIRDGARPSEIGAMKAARRAAMNT